MILQATIEAMLIAGAVVLAIGLYVGMAATEYAHHRREQRMASRTLQPVAAWAPSGWYCAEHVPEDEFVIWASPWGYVAPEQCSVWGCGVEILELAQHQCPDEEIALGLERFNDLPPRAQDRVRAALDRVNAGDGCVVCGELNDQCYCDGTDAISVAHASDDHSRCSIWCSERLGQVDLT